MSKNLNINQPFRLPVRAGLIFSIIFALTASYSMLCAQEEEALSYRQTIEKLRPMLHVGLDPKLGRILDNYYESNYTSAHHWDKIQSMRFDGVLETPEGELRFVAFKKKPDYYKVVIYVGEAARYVMAYDGEDAWQFSTAEGEAVDMPEMEALDFIRDATLGGHLFYPQFPGKEIRLDGSVLVDGERCYRLLITLPDGDQIVSALDFSSFSERQQSVVNHVTGKTEVNTHGKFGIVDGVRIPFLSILHVDGEKVHSVKMIQVQANVGIMSWMFQRPSGALIPDAPSDSLGGSAFGVESPSQATFGSEGSAFESETKAPASDWDAPELAPLEIEKLLKGVK
ncbi:MAG: hypothetical protein ACSHX4_02955 [Opitutaceae bacterium]